MIFLVCGLTFLPARLYPLTLIVSNLFIFLFLYRLFFDVLYPLQAINSHPQYLISMVLYTRHSIFHLILNSSGACLSYSFKSLSVASEYTSNGTKATRGITGCRFRHHPATPSNTATAVVPLNILKVGWASLIHLLLSFCTAFDWIKVNPNTLTGSFMSLFIVHSSLLLFLIIAYLLFLAF